MSYIQIPIRNNGVDLNNAADLNQLQLNLDAMKGGTPSAAPTRTLEELAIQSRKQYVVGTAYTNGTPSVSCPNSGFVIRRGILIPYQLLGGDWRIIFQIVFSNNPSGTDPALTLSGVTSKNISLYYQSGYSAVDASGGWTFGEFRNTFRVAPNSNIFTAVATSVTAENYSCWGDFELNSKPTWAD